MITALGLGVACWNCGSTEAASITNQGGPNVSGQQTSAAAIPVKVAIVPDQTGSRNWTRTPSVRPEDLTPLIDLFRSRGGEIGVGLIRDDSNRSLVRLRVERPPVAPYQPADTGNAFALLEQRSRYEQTLARYRQDHADWEAVTNGRINIFLSSIKPLLNPAVPLPLRMFGEPRVGSIRSWPRTTRHGAARQAAGQCSSPTVRITSLILQRRFRAALNCS
jgi:hypothetical protein